MEQHAKLGPNSTVRELREEAERQLRAAGDEPSTLNIAIKFEQLNREAGASWTRMQWDV